MSHTIARTARKPHECDTCWWTPSLRGVSTILPGHRYLLHTAFPGEEGYEEGTRPARLTECAEHAIDRTAGVAASEFGICAAWCHGTSPCVLPLAKGAPSHDHQCRECLEEAAR